MIERLIYIAAAREARRRGAAVAPRLMTFNITNRCNAKCAMCEIHRWSASAGDEMDAARFGELISDPMLRKLEVVRITGGEPFLHADLPGVVRILKKKLRGGVIYITTNGSMPGRVGPVVEAGSGGRAKLHVMVSLDSLDETHDRLRGVGGMLEKAKETVRSLAELKKKHDFYAGINQTVMKETLPHIDEVAGFARELGLGHHLFLGAQFHEGKEMKGENPLEKEMTFRPQDGMTREEMESFYRRHAELKRDGAAAARRGGFRGAFLRELSEEYLNEGGRNRALEGRAAPKPPCMAMFTHFRLAPDGGVFPCSVFRNLSAGNIHGKSFSEIWKGPAAAEIRKKVISCKGCWIECDINPSVFYSGDIIPWYMSHFLKDREFRKHYLFIK